MRQAGLLWCHFTKICMFGLLGIGLFSPNISWAQGMLIPTQRNIAPLSIKHHRVQVKIQDRAAHTTVSQVFKNHTNRILEATYIFPLPPGATISNFVLYINGKPKRGVILKKNRAQAIYQSIVRRMKDPGLLEYMGGRLFRARIFPIPRRGEQRIKISFTQMVPYSGGLHRFVYPLKTRHRARRTSRDFTMSVELKSKTPLKNIYSPTHKVSLARKGDHRAIVGFEKNQALLNRDFVLYYSVSQKDLGLNLLSHKQGGKDGYFLMMLTPKVSYGSKELSGKNITFVLDTSGSMSGAKMKWAKRALRVCLGKLNPKDHFNVIRFSTDVEALFKGLQKATRGRINKAQRFVKRMEAAGGTAINHAMKLALSQKPKGDGVSLVVFITDGHPTIGETTPSRIVKNSKKSNRHKARVYTFGIGNNINTKLLDKMAQLTGGTGDYVKPNKEITQRISTFYDKVRYPVLSNIRLSVGHGIRLTDMYPKQIPDLFRGGQLAVFGRYRGKGSVAITLKGSINGKRKRFVFETTFPKVSSKHSFVSRLWANRKVAYLLDHIRLKGSNPELRNEIIRLSKKFGIVTPYTSYLVVEKKDEWRLRPPSTIARRPMLMKGFRGRTRSNRHFRRRSRRLKPSIAFRRRPQSNLGSSDRSATDRPAAAPERGLSPLGGYAPRKRMSLDDLRKESGQKAVDNSRIIKKMKRNKVMGRSNITRFVRGRLFVWKRGGWVDSKYKSSMKVLRLKYMSALYFKLLSKRPNLRKFFALGRRVTVVVGRNYAIVIGNQEKRLTTSQFNKSLHKIRRK